MALFQGKVGLSSAVCAQCWRLRRTLSTGERGWTHRRKPPSLGWGLSLGTVLGGGSRAPREGRQQRSQSKWFRRGVF